MGTKSSSSPEQSPALKGKMDASQLASKRRIDPLIGSKINNLRILGLIGKGGFGAVYRAKHMSLGTYAAIKVLWPHVQDNKEMLERFFREAQSVARLNHPNIVRVSDFGFLPEHGHYLVMEYLDGSTLSKSIKENERFDKTSLLRMYKQLCSALFLIHDEGIVHRDLKPGNIFLVPALDEPEMRDVKLLDFGIAALATEDTLTVSGISMGSPRYMSPEQAGGRSSEVDGRSDLYSIGIILYQLLTGEAPFEDSNQSALILKHLTEEVPYLRDKAPNVHWEPELEDFLQMALAKAPKDRPADAKVFFEELEKAMEDQLDWWNPEEGATTISRLPLDESAFRQPIETTTTPTPQPTPQKLPPPTTKDSQTAIPGIVELPLEEVPNPFNDYAPTTPLRALSPNAKDSLFPPMMEMRVDESTMRLPPQEFILPMEEEEEFLLPIDEEDAQEASVVVGKPLPPAPPRKAPPAPPQHGPIRSLSPLDRPRSAPTGGFAGLPSPSEEAPYSVRHPSLQQADIPATIDEETERLSPSLNPFSQPEGGVRMVQIIDRNNPQGPPPQPQSKPQPANTRPPSTYKPMPMADMASSNRSLLGDWQGEKGKGSSNHWLKIAVAVLAVVFVGLLLTAYLLGRF